MPQRPCLDCGRLASGTRCPACSSAVGRARDARRGSKQARGYGAEHEARRAALLEDLRKHPGQPCPRCGEAMLPSQALDAGHPIGSPLRLDPTSKADHLSHARCNRGAQD